MDITFLVGNGFDLSLGYKTSYMDFYQYYLDQPNDPKHDEAISRLKKSIEKDRENELENWSDFEIGLGRCSRLFSSKEANDFVDASSNAFKSMIEYLSELPRKNDIDAVSEKQWEMIRKKLCNFHSGAREQDRRGFSRLKQDEQDHGWEARFHFISFNYTNFLDEYIEKIAQKPLETWKRGSEERKHILEPNVFHVHGTLNDYPIVGVSNEEQILNHDLLASDYLRQTLIKSNSIKEIRSPRYDEVKMTINKSRIVCLWGLSLGQSDKHCWDYINRWLRDDPNRSVFIFEYSDDPPDPTLVSDYYQKRRKVAFRLLDHSNFTKEEKESLLSRIYVVFNTKDVLVFPSNDTSTTQ